MKKVILIIFLNFMISGLAKAERVQVPMNLYPWDKSEKGPIRHTPPQTRFPIVEIDDGVVDVKFSKNNICFNLVLNDTFGNTIYNINATSTPCMIFDIPKNIIEETASIMIITTAHTYIGYIH